MKRLLCALLCAAMALLCGCTGAGGTESASSKSAVSSLPPTPSVSSTSSTQSTPSSSSAPSSSSVPAISSTPPVVPTTAGEFADYSNKKICWGQGVIVNEKNQPVTCPQYNQKYGKYGAVFMGTNEKNIYLTFDEGYENGYTAKILDVLKEKNVSAVFFVTYDYVSKNAALVQRMIDEGHIVGNHSWSHPSMPNKSDDEVKSEIQKLHDYVLKNFGYSMNLFRPPMGEFSERTLAITQSLGYKTVLWSFAYLDYDTKNQPTEEKAFSRVTGAEHGGAVYLLHAVSATNTAILGRVIDNMRSNGYSIAKFDV